MGVDADHDVVAICQHPRCLRLGGDAVSVWDVETTGDRTVTGHAASADRLLIRSTNGCQTGTAPRSRTDRTEDTETRTSQAYFESRERSTAPDWQRPQTEPPPPPSLTGLFGRCRPSTTLR